jgi:hypothetical protein
MPQKFPLHFSIIFWEMKQPWAFLGDLGGSNLGLLSPTYSLFPINFFPENFDNFSKY